MKKTLIVVLAFGALLSMHATLTAETNETLSAVLANGHLLHIDGAEASFCTCGKDCTCTIAENGTHCTCGKEAQRVDITGKYYCKKCDGSISDKPGTCPACGEPLTEAK